MNLPNGNNECGMRDGVTVKGISPAEASKFETLFKLLDEECSGGISKEALADLMPRMGVFPSEDELSELFNSVDTDGSGEIDFHEFLQLMSRHREANQLALLEGGRECFAHLKSASMLKEVIRPDDPLNWVLDIVVLCVNVFWIGIVTYDDVRPNSDNVRLLEAKLLSSAILTLDVVRGMLTSYTPEGADTLPIDSLKHVRKRYLESKRVVFDVAAALPFDLVMVFANQMYAMRVLQHLRLLKVFSLKELFKITPRDTLSPAYAQFFFTFVPLCNICFWAVMTVHFLCLIWIIMEEEQGSTSYIEAMYFVVYTLTTTGYGDVAVESDLQKGFCIFLFCCASVVTGLVVGKLVQFSQQADLQTDANRRMLETLAALNHLTIPRDFKEEVLAFQLHRLKHSNSLFNDTISELPQVMQDRMALYARMKIVRQVPIFAEAQEICVAKLAQSLVNVFVPPEEYIVIAGEEGEEMFFLFHGMCGVTLPDGKWAATIRRGGVFGEVALLQETRRSASIKSLTYCQLFRLDKVHHHHTTLPPHNHNHLPPSPTGSIRAHCAMVPHTSRLHPGRQRCTADADCVCTPHIIALTHHHHHPPPQKPDEKRQTRQRRRRGSECDTGIP